MHRDDVRAVKRPRVAAGDGATQTHASSMGDIQEQLKRTSDPHLQAKLLLEYSTRAVPAEAETTAAIDFLFAFLQQNQSQHASGNAMGDEANGSSSGNTTGGTSSAVVVAAIVRGLRALLPLKRSSVEPMIQYDAMSDQLVQCVSVPEDFKLRRDMLRIVVDCLFNVDQRGAVEQLLAVCVADHDDGVRTICLEAYIRLIGSGFEFQDTVAQTLVSRLTAMLLYHDDETTRRTAARVLANFSHATFASAVDVAAVYDTLLNALAAGSRDDSSRVRLEIATGFTWLAAIPATAFEHLFSKKQIDEDLAKLDENNASLLSSGSVLALLEDPDPKVSAAMSASIRALCGGHSLTSTLLDRVIEAHLDRLGSGRLAEQNANEFVSTLAVLLPKREHLTGTKFEVSREELSSLFGSLPRTNLQLGCVVVTLLPHLQIDHTFGIATVVQFVIELGNIDSVVDVEDKLITSVQVAFKHFVSTISERGIQLPEDTLASLKQIIDTKSKNPISQHCRALVDAASRNAEPQAAQFPRFLGVRPSFRLEQRGLPDPEIQAICARICSRLKHIQMLCKRPPSRSHASILAHPVVPSACNSLLRSSRQLFVRGENKFTTTAHATLLKLIFLGVLGSVDGASAEGRTAIEVARTDFLLRSVDLHELELLRSVVNDNASSVERILRSVAVSVSEDEVVRGLYTGYPESAIRGVIVEPSRLSTREVASQMPLSVCVKAHVFHVSPEHELFVEAKASDGNSLYFPLLASIMSATTYTGEITLPSKQCSSRCEVLLTVCMKTRAPLAPIQPDHYYHVSSTVTIYFQQKQAQVPRHTASRNN